MLLKSQAFGRTCDECTACCYTHGVQGIDKNMHEWCPDCSVAKGCRKYDGRPPACQEFSCLWLSGYGNEDDRPDKLGVVQSIDIESMGSKTVTLMEYMPDALQKPRVVEITKELLGHGQFVAQIPIHGLWRVILPVGKTETDLNKNHPRGIGVEIINAVDFPS